MASNPPFQVEDTDEDFFDKLVDDDDDVDFKVTASSAARSSSLDSVGQVFGDGNDSDEVKAFANLSINDVSSHQVDDSKKIGVDAIQQNGDVHDNVAGETKGSLKLQGDVKESESVLKSKNSFDFGEITESNTHNNVGVEGASDTNLNPDTGPGATGVKEVQWSVFHEDGTQNDGSGFGSYSDFFSELSEKTIDSSEIVPGNFQTDITKTPPSGGGDIIESSNLVNSDQGFQEAYNYGASVQQTPLEQDQNSIAYWESLYPGWKINPNTGEWYQVDGYEADQGQGQGQVQVQNQQGNAQAFSASAWDSVGGGGNNPEVSYMQQSFQPVSGITEDSGITQNVTTWNQESNPNGATGITSISNQVLQGTENAATLDWNQSSAANNGYPFHMVFDPQYPDWYYDTITQEWKSLESYNLSSNVTVQEQKQNGFSTTDPAASIEYQNAYGQVKNNGVQGLDTQGQNVVWSGSSTNYSPQDLNTWQHETVGKTEPFIDYRQNQQVGSQYGLDSYRNDHSTQQVANDYGRAPSFYEEKHQSQHFSTFATPQSNVPLGSFSQQYSHRLSEQKPGSNDYYSNQNTSSFSQKQFHGSQQFSYAPVAERSSAGRPLHALVAFGFGGKLIVAKDNNTSFGNQNHVGSSISVLNLRDVLVENTDNDSGLGSSDYLRTLCLQSFPGPLISGGGGLKELNKWFDERIEKCQFLQKNRDVLRLLLSLLKLSCQYYGKLRSPIGSDNILKESDAPEVAVARLFASAKTNATQFNQYGDITNCLQRLPSEAQMRATAAEVQNLLVSGKKIEALHCAQDGQLWGPAIVLAAQFGNQFYAETVKQMGLRQLAPGSPLRTLCLLIAGQPADVFDIPANSGMFGAVNMNQQPTQFSSNGVVDDWEENLAVITANRTKDDELVLLNLGDCIWKEKNDVIAAHICYLVAEANFEVYSDTARLCLVGADHWKFPRTYASPEAIQRTEIYEYSKVMGNSQFTLLPFQPYKFVYALMLAEVGRISDSLKYCQLVLKSLKTARAPEAENLRQLVSALEERIKTHQQGGFSTNLAPAKLVGKLLNLFDSTAQRVVGGIPPPIPSTSGSNPPINEHHQPGGGGGGGSRVSASQSTMAMSSLMDSTSEWSANNNKMTMHTRSVSEPDFSRSPTQDQVDSSKGASSTNSGGEKSSGGSSRLGRFGFGSGLLQKTVGLVLRPRHGKEAKLGEQNKFYYDEKLKSWVEEGAKPPSEVLAPPPPPTSTPAFLNGSTDYNLKAALKGEGSFNNGSPELKTPPVDHGSGIPPLPPTSNQYSARGRMGVRSRYVDTFNQSGGNQTNLFQTPSSSLPTNNNNKPSSTTSNPKFFVPAPITSSPPQEPSFDNLPDTKHHTSLPNEFENPIPTNNNNNNIPSMMSSTIQRNGSFDSISATTTNNTSFSGPARRTASWSGSFSGNTSPPFSKEARPLGEVLGMSSSSPTYNPRNNNITSFPINGGAGFGDELHEVEL